MLPIRARSGVRQSPRSASTRLCALAVATYPTPRCYLFATARRRCRPSADIRQDVRALGTPAPQNSDLERVGFPIPRRVQDIFTATKKRNCHLLRVQSSRKSFSTVTLGFANGQATLSGLLRLISLDLSSRCRVCKLQSLIEQLNKFAMHRKILSSPRFGLRMPRRQ